jgi:hypothetical protein
VNEGAQQRLVVADCVNGQLGLDTDAQKYSDQLIYILKQVAKREESLAAISPEYMKPAPDAAIWREGDQNLFEIEIYVRSGVPLRLASR